MSELIPFSQIPDKWDWNYDHPDEEYPYTDDQAEAAEFLAKMDWEGGIDGLIGYGGWEIFPEELHEQARAYEYAGMVLKKALDDWAAERGVVY